MVVSRRSSANGPGGDDPFGSTRWSLVLAVGRDESANEALETLCRSYWLPVYAFVRRRSRDSEDARDLTQAFFVFLLEKNVISKADYGRGRFRAFLVTTLKNFLANEHQKAHAKKRGGGAGLLSLDFDAAENHLRRDARAQLTPEQDFERRWALALLERVINRLEQEYISGGRPRQFQELRFALTGQNPEIKHAEVARRLGISEEAVRAAIYRLRQRYRTLLLDEISQTVASPDDVDDEIETLFSALGS